MIAKKFLCQYSQIWCQGCRKRLRAGGTNRAKGACRAAGENRRNRTNKAFCHVLLLFLLLFILVQLKHQRFDALLPPEWKKLSFFSFILLKFKLICMITMSCFLSWGASSAPPCPPVRGQGGAAAPLAPPTSGTLVWWKFHMGIDMGNGNNIGWFGLIHETVLISFLHP